MTPAGWTGWLCGLAETDTESERYVRRVGLSLIGHILSSASSGKVHEKPRRPGERLVYRIA